MSELLMGSLAEKQRQRVCSSFIEQHWRSPSPTGPTTVTYLLDRGLGLVQAGGSRGERTGPSRAWHADGSRQVPPHAPQGSGTRPGGKRGSNTKVRDATGVKSGAARRERLRHSCVLHGPRRPQDQVGPRTSVCRPPSSTRLDANQRPLYALPV